MILIIDNYDSFTYNIYQYVTQQGATAEVVRNDEISIQRVTELKPSGIIISPGPGRPEDAGISVELIRSVAGKIPLLGVCLGHQALGYAYGGKIINAPQIMHGKVSLIEHQGEGIFQGVTNPFRATRYHSLVVERSSLPAELEVTAWCDRDLIMGLRHKKHHNLLGVQFHPESILTEPGLQLIANFLKLTADSAN